MATERKKPNARELASEAAPRRLDPFEADFMGVIRSNDPLLRARGETVDAYVDLARDGKVYANLGRRIAALVSRPWSVQPAREGDAASAEALSALLRRLPFDQLCRDLMGALLTGYAVVEIIWEAADGLWLPKSMPVRRPTRFVYADDPDGGGMALRLLTKRDMLRGERLPDKKFIVHRFEPRDDNPYGTGLGLYLFWPVYFKRKGIVAWAKFCDRFGTPTPWGRYPAGAEKKDKATLAEALRAFSNDGYIMTPEGALIELLEANAGGNITTQESLVRAMDNAIAEIILGQESGMHSGGALAAAAKERADVRLDLVQADSDLLSETLNGTLIKWLCEFHGLGPCAVCRQIKEEVDLKAASETDVNVASLGFELSEEAARARYGDGWSKREAPNAALGVQDAPGAQFAEPDSTPPDATTSAAGRLAQESAPAIEGWMQTAEAMLEVAGSLEEFREMLLAAFPRLDSDALAETLAAAFAAAGLRGRSDVADEAGQP